MDKKIIAIDLDGTLLNSESKLTPYTIDILQQVQQLGHRIIIATGRPYRMTEQIYSDLGLTSPMINFNGSLVHIPHQSWEWEKSWLIDKKYLLEFLKMTESFEADFIACEYKHKFFITQDYLENFPPQLMGVEAIGIDSLMRPEKIKSNPHSILMQTRVADKYDLAKHMNQHFRHELEINTWGGPLNILETCAKGVTKASALSYLLDLFQASSKDLIAFGDEHNDVAMLQLAGRAYAMKNASDTLLPYADQLTEFTNKEDGVARELEKLFL